ncbi:MAG: universal stress protein [Candidatus Binataceae bacterium]|jgi:nucleotide-binding universal stress UspA family protein
MPFPYKRILCGVASDECSSEALKEATALALNGQASLHVLHVVQVRPLLDLGSVGAVAFVLSTAVIALRYFR